MLTKTRESWTQAENDLIRQLYPADFVTLAKRLENRSTAAIRQQASKLGVKSQAVTIFVRKEARPMQAAAPAASVSLEGLPWVRWPKTGKECRSLAARLHTFDAADGTIQTICATLEALANRLEAAA